MQDSFADSMLFSDPVFPRLNAKEAAAMWRMFVEKGKDLHIDLYDVKCSENTVDAFWLAKYSFGEYEVENHIHSHFVVKEGKILRQIDDFDFYAWAKQAFGWKGYVFGWTQTMQSKVQENALRSLKKFIQKID